MTDNNNQDDASNGKKRNFFAPWLQKVMFGGLNNSINSFLDPESQKRQVSIFDLLFDLYRTNQVRFLYEKIPVLPVSGLFYMGGKLNALIRDAERALDPKSGVVFEDRTRPTLRERVREAKEFRKYLIRRIRDGK